MESILPEFSWEPHQRTCDLPEAQLIHAIILSAWQDSNKKFGCPVRNEARDWFNSGRFYELCDLIDFPPDVIQEYVTKSWRKA